MLGLFVMEIVFVVLVGGINSLLVALLFARVNEQEEEGQGRGNKCTKVIEDWRAPDEDVKVAD